MLNVAYSNVSGAQLTMEASALFILGKLTWVPQTEHSREHL